MLTAAPILETPRLELREVTLGDAPFFLRLLNDPSWLENIGDRGVQKYWTLAEILDGEVAPLS